MTKNISIKEYLSAAKELIVSLFIKQCEYCKKRLKRDEGIEKVVLVYWARVKREKYFCNAKHFDLYDKKVKDYWGTDKSAECCG